MNYYTSCRQTAGLLREAQTHRSPFLPEGLFKQRWLLLLPALFLLLSSQSGCSGERKETAGTSSAKACSLVTQTEMEEITGRPMNITEEKVSAETSTCTFVSTDEAGKGGNGPMISFSLLAQTSDNSDADTAYSQYVAGLKKNANMEVTEVQGVGQKACWSEDVRQLTVFSGRHMLLLSAGMKEQGTLDTCRRIMAKVLPRLAKE